jgi:hypothetical protein
VAHHQVETRILEKNLYTTTWTVHQEWGNEISFYNGWGGAHLCIRDVESALVATLFVVSSVGSPTCGLESSSEVALPVESENVGRSVRDWVGFIGSGVFIPRVIQVLFFVICTCSS